DDVPVYRTISVNAGATTTVALEASPVETRTVTISPAGAATGTWAVEVGVLTGNAYANGVQPTFVGVGLQSQTVTNNTLSVKYRPADVSTTSVMIRKDTAPQLWFQTPMSSLLANGTVTVPTLSVSNLSCTGQTCTAGVGVSPHWVNQQRIRFGNVQYNGHGYIQPGCHGKCVYAGREQLVTVHGHEAGDHSSYRTVITQLPGPPRLEGDPASDFVRLLASPETVAPRTFVGGQDRTDFRGEDVRTD
ncbi:MAG: hypothetical protein EBT00_11475, partial [Proteobacteria bacterium]|nr:hypothetical protein [Pseudomonadota bacterium]